MLVIMIFVYVVFILCFLVMRNSNKRQNPKHSFLDDFLMFTGSPVLLAYILVIVFNPNNADKIVRDLFATPLTYCLMAWALLATIWYIVRYSKNVPKWASCIWRLFLFEIHIIIFNFYSLVYYYIGINGRYYKEIKNNIKKI